MLSSEKEKVKQSQTVTKGGTPARHPPLGAGLGASQISSGFPGLCFLFFLEYCLISL